MPGQNIQWSTYNFPPKSGCFLHRLEQASAHALCPSWGLHLGQLIARKVAMSAMSKSKTVLWCLFNYSISC